MRKAIQVLILLVVAAVAALGQPAQCRVTKTFYTLSGQPDRNATLTVFQIRLGGAGNPAYAIGRAVFRTDSQGRLLGADGVTVGVDLPQGALVWLYSGANAQLPQLAANPNAGTQYQVPNKSTAGLEELIWNLATFRAKGDLLIGGANGIPARFAVCPDGQAIIADATQAQGWRCGTAGAVTSVFGRTGAVTAQTGDYSFAQIGSKPTTLAGYGITDAAALSHTHPASQISDSTAVGRTLLMAVDAAAQRTALGLAVIASSGSASDLGAGTVPSARLSGSYTGLTGVGTIGAGTWQGSVIAPAFLGTGTPSASNFLRGDGSWQTVPITTINTTDGVIPYRLNSGAFADSPISRVDGTTVQVAGINGGSAANDDLTIQGTSNSTRTSSYVVLQPAGGNVGIGTGSPAQKVSVYGSQNGTVREVIYGAYTSDGIYLGGLGNAGLSPNNSAALLDPNGNNVLVWQAGRLLLQTPIERSAAAVQIYPTVSVDPGFVVLSQNVNHRPMVVRGATGQNLNLFELQASNTSTYSAFNNTGQLGVGVSAPVAQLDVRPSSSSTIGQVLRLASGQTANALEVQNSTGTLLSGVAASGAFYSAGVTQANLGTPANGTFVFCTDCTIASPCASGGTGALAKRLNSVWVCN